MNKDRALEDLDTLLDLFPHDPDRLMTMLCILRRQKKIRNKGQRDHEEIESILSVMGRKYN